MSKSKVQLADDCEIMNAAYHIKPLITVSLIPKYLNCITDLFCYLLTTVALLYRIHKSRLWQSLLLMVDCR